MLDALFYRELVLEFDVILFVREHFVPEVVLISFHVLELVHDFSMMIVTSSRMVLSTKLLVFWKIFCY